jgi:hypothetical protein
MTAGETADGEYLIDSDGNGPRRPFSVFCQFNVQEFTAWTLVTSWRRDKDSHFHSKTFTESAATNQNTPSKKNEVYRLSRERMTELKSESDFWRTSCNLDNAPQRDFAIARFSEMDILSFTGGGVCKKMMKVHVIN